MDQPSRGSFDRQAWRQAYQELVDLPRDDLDVADLERLAVAAYLIGADDESLSAWEAAHRRYVAQGDPAEGARCTFWLALGLLLRGQAAQAGGWLSRAANLVETAGGECRAAGYVLIPAMLGSLEGGELSVAHELALRATEVGLRCGDPDLRAFGLLGQGQVLIAQGDAAAGTAKLDEVMVSVTLGEVGPIASGIVYCAVILECMRLFDLARAAEWTEALTAWCDAQPDLVPYRGQCLVHRSQIQQAAGEWREAIRTAESACERLSVPPHPALGLAYYQQAELHRLVGAWDEASTSYRQANNQGYEPMPGLALLELASGDPGGAAATIRRALQEGGGPVERPARLVAAVDILEAIGDLAGARAAAEELAEIAAASTSEVLRAMAAQATGAVLVWEGDASAALAHLRAAAAAWQRLHLSYERARTAVLLGRACDALGDEASASLEYDVAHEVFVELGASPDLARLRTLIEGPPAPAHAARAEPTDPTEAADQRPALSARELEVLAHVASGRTNREIATELVVSQHTVSRHLENIFTKLGVSSRAAATAYAYEHGLL